MTTATKTRALAQVHFRKADLPAALAFCDDKIADFRIKAAAIRQDPARWEERHELLRNVDAYQKVKDILRALYS